MTEEEWFTEPVWELLLYASNEIPTVPSRWLELLLSEQGSPPPHRSPLAMGHKGRKHWLLMLAITRLYWGSLSPKSRGVVEWLQRNEELPSPRMDDAVEGWDRLSDLLHGDTEVALESARRAGMVEVGWLSEFQWPDCYVEFRWSPDRVESWRPLIYDIFGNPFRPVAFSSEWRTDTALAVARGMYESRDFGAMPILANALQDAGCDNVATLDHCHDANATHVRGCWVVDLVLGRE